MSDGTGNDIASPCGRCYAEQMDDLFIRPEVSDLFICNIRECLRDGKLKEIEYPLEVDGSLHYFQARIAPFEGNRVLALIHDIGDRIQRSQELIELNVVRKMLIK